MLSLQHTPQRNISGHNAHVNVQQIRDRCRNNQVSIQLAGQKRTNVKTGRRPFVGKPGSGLQWESVVLPLMRTVPSPGWIEIRTIPEPLALILVATRQLVSENPGFERSNYAFVPNFEVSICFRSGANMRTDHFACVWQPACRPRDIQKDT